MRYDVRRTATVAVQFNDVVGITMCTMGKGKALKQYLVGLQYYVYYNIVLLVYSY